MEKKLKTKILLICLSLIINITLINCDFISQSRTNKDIKTDDCSTPIDCFTQAINALNLAKQTYYSAVDKIESIQNTLTSYIDEKVKNSTGENKAYAETIRNELISKINAGQDFSNARLNDINNSVHYHSCREIDTNCSDDGDGNFVYADRHSVACNDNEFMKLWKWIRCDGNTIRVHYVCCRNS